MSTLTEKVLVLPARSQSEDIKEYQLSEPGFMLRVFSSFDQLADDWVAAQPSRNIYLQRPVLKTLEEAPPKDIKACYLIFYKNKLPVGVAYCQVIKFKTDENVQDKEAKGALRSLTGSVKNFLAKRLEYSLLVCGNLLYTGEHGYHFDKNISQKQIARLLEDALEKTQSYWKAKNVKTDGIFIKDIGEEQATCREEVLGMKFRQFLFHPNMVLFMRPEWKGFDDYMGAISSKYRIRVKKTFKSGMPMKKMELGIEQLQAHVDHLYGLYKGVMATAKFNMVVLNENYAIRLKENLGDRLLVMGYYLDGELIGYRTNIVNYDEVEAHFLGYDQSYNKQYKLYMNMLLDSLQFGFDHQAQRVVYARTAMEIKSTIGAEPEELYCYIRANNKLLNRIMPSLLEYFRPEDNWVQRHPFKDPVN